MGIESSNRGTLRGAVFGSMIGLVVGMLLVVAFPAMAGPVGEVAAEPWDPLLLGKLNTIDSISVLRGAPESHLLRLKHMGTQGTALQLAVTPGNAPLWVNSSTQVARLNADLLDGQHAAEFAGAGHNHDADYLGIGDQAADSDTVDGNKGIELVRVAHAETNNVDDATVFGGGDSGILLSTSITAPVAGLLFIVGSAESYVLISGADGDQYTCELSVGIAEVTGSRRFMRPAKQDPPYTNANDQNCATNGVKEVTAGAHTVALVVGARGTSEPKAYFDGASLQVLFVPFDATGN